MKLIRKADIILFIFLMGMAGLLFALPFLRIHTSASNQGGLQVTVRQNGKPAGTYALDRNRNITIRNGKHVNVIQIRDNSVCMKSSTCKNQVCVDEGKISRAGQSIICLPNRVVVEIQERKPASTNKRNQDSWSGDSSGVSISDGSAAEDQGVDAVVK